MVEAMARRWLLNACIFVTYTAVPMAELAGRCKGTSDFSPLYSLSLVTVQCKGPDIRADGQCPYHYG